MNNFNQLINNSNINIELVDRNEANDESTWKVTINLPEEIVYRGEERAATPIVKEYNDNFESTLEEVEEYLANDIATKLSISREEFEAHLDD